MTMQTFLAGLYPPVNWSKWDENLNWQPIPFGIDDALLAMWNIDECVAWGESFDSTNSIENPAAKEIYENNQVFFDFSVFLTFFPPHY